MYIFLSIYIYIHKEGSALFFFFRSVATPSFSLPFFLFFISVRLLLGFFFFLLRVKHCNSFLFIEICKLIENTMTVYTHTRE